MLYRDARSTNFAGNNTRACRFFVKDRDSHIMWRLQTDGNYLALGTLGGMHTGLTLGAN